MSKELKEIEDKAITIYENMLPKQVKGKLVYPKAYLEDDVKALIKKVKAEARRELLKKLKPIIMYALKKAKEDENETNDYIKELRDRYWKKAMYLANNDQKLAMRIFDKNYCDWLMEGV